MNFMLNKLHLSLLFALLLSACQATDNEASAPPAETKIKNLVLITIDTVRADTFFAADEHQYDDRLSPWLKKARVYRQAQSVAPWTIPAVATVLTGYYPNQHGAGKFPTVIANLNTQTPSAVLTNVTTVAERLQAVGYKTEAASAHPWFSLDFGMQRGFSEVHQRKSSKIDAWFTKNVSQWDSSGDGQLHFTYLHYMQAHEMHMQKGDKFKQTFASLSAEQLQRGADWNDLQQCQKNIKRRVCRQYVIYTQAVLELRDSIANTLETLESQGHLDDTLVVVYSDHGEEFHDHRKQALEDNHDPRGIAGFGHGNSMYQELLRVPVLIWNPADETGRVIDNPISLIDIAPSMLDWLGVDSGDDRLPGMLLDDAEKQTERAIYASSIAYGPEQIAVREENSKSIWNTVSDESRYFDLGVDPLEQKPILTDELVLQFDQLTGDYLDLASSRIGLAPEINEEQLQHLKAIGYLQGSDPDAADNNPEAKNTEHFNLPDPSMPDTNNETDEPDDEN